MQFALWLETLNTWFAGSKVVDKNGNLLKVYHGSPNPNFANFSLTAPRNNMHEAGEIGIWFTSDPKVASSFAEKEETEYVTDPNDPTWKDGSPKQYVNHVKKVGGVFPVYLKILQPKVYNGKDGFEDMLDDRDQFATYINGTKGEKGFWRRRYINTNKSEATQMYKEWLIKQGHDGIIINQSLWDSVDKVPHAQFVVFNPNQIRSVFAK